MLVLKVDVETAGIPTISKPGDCSAGVAALLVLRWLHVSDQCRKRRYCSFRSTCTEVMPFLLMGAMLVAAKLLVLGGFLCGD